MSPKTAQVPPILAAQPPPILAVQAPPVLAAQPPPILAVQPPPKLAVQIPSVQRRVVQFGVRSKVRVRELSRILTNN